jgi:hypothetical protein
MLHQISAKSKDVDWSRPDGGVIRKEEIEPVSQHQMSLRALYHYHDKLIIGFSSIFAAGISHLGAILSEGEVRWFFVTVSVSLITAVFLAMMFKRPDETIQLMAARCGFTLLGGVFLTKGVAHHMGIELIERDIIAFGGLTCGVAITTFILGYQILRYLERRSEYLAKKFVDSKIGTFLGETTRRKSR